MFLHYVVLKISRLHLGQLACIDSDCQLATDQCVPKDSNLSFYSIQCYICWVTLYKLADMPWLGWLETAPVCWLLLTGLCPNKEVASLNNNTGSTKHCGVNRHHLNLHIDLFCATWTLENSDNGAAATYELPHRWCQHCSASLPPTVVWYNSALVKTAVINKGKSNE